MDKKNQTPENGTQESTGKGFEVIDADKGLFSLWDTIFQTKREWQISDEASPGVALLMEKAEKNGQKIMEKVPEGKKIHDVLKTMSTEEQNELLSNVQKNAHRQISYMSTICTPLFELPDIFENKIDALAACLNDKKDSAKITAFFLARSVSTTMLDGDLKVEMNRILEKL